MTAGRPTPYDPSFCKRLIEWMSHGMSFESFAGEVSVGRATVHNWARAHPEFLEAKAIGQAKCLVFWEKLGIKAAAGGIKNFAATAYVFQMKNKFGWRDKVDVDVIGTVNHTHEHEVKLLVQDIMKVMTKPNDGQIPLELTHGLLDGNIPIGTQREIEIEPISYGEGTTGIPGY